MNLKHVSRLFYSHDPSGVKSRAFSYHTDKLVYSSHPLSLSSSPSHVTASVHSRRSLLFTLPFNTVTQLSVPHLNCQYLSTVHYLTDKNTVMVLSKQVTTALHPSTKHVLISSKLQNGGNPHSTDLPIKIFEYLSQ